MVDHQCHHPFLPVKLRGQHSRVRLHANFRRGSRTITYPKTRNCGRLESRRRLFMAVHATANIPEFLSSRSLPVHHQYWNQLVNQYRSCSNSNTGLHLFQEKTPQQRHRGDASDHGRHYPVYPYPPGNHTATGLHSRLPGSSGKLYTSHRGRENHCRQSQYLRTPKMRDLRVHHVLGRHVSHTFLDLNRPRGTLFCQRTHGRSVFNALPA